ncbi:MAG: formylglycine-generating enzyme family protein [Cyanobacteria bacterium P01_F01_bin.143]
MNAQGQEINREKGQAEYYSERLSSDVTLEMMAIPGGKFFMGSPLGEGDDDEKPQRKVTIQPFFMGKYPVTQAQWQAVMGNNPARFKDNLLKPVERVYWHDAVDFCEKLSTKTGRKYRLPSEAEWEYACRAVISPKGYRSAYDQLTVNSEELTVEQWNEKYHQPFYFSETITSNLANYNANYTFAKEAPGEYRKTTTAVGTFPSNKFGLYDMHGNVWQWCADNWHGNYEGAPIDGTAWTKGGDNNLFLLRGGSWLNNPNHCRSANRYSNRRDVIYHDVGFRVVRS